MLIRPRNFGFNRDTASTNVFQNDVKGKVTKKALTEFETVVRTLRANKIKIVVFDDLLTRKTPDSVFPNNWISTHENGTVVLYPMYAPNRRLERRKDIIQKLKQDGFAVKKILDLSVNEKDNRFLEGTGSMVFDRENKVLYAALSSRTNAGLVDEFAAKIGYSSVKFLALDSNGVPIYHTDVMMSICEGFAIVCLESIKEKSERDKVLNSLTKSGRVIIDISLKQVENFLGNSLEVMDREGNPVLLMSDTAFSILTDVQRESINQFCRILHVNIDTIEKVGGGSLRCMLAEIFLKKKR